MNIEPKPFQEKAINALRERVAAALGVYNTMQIPQVISLQAPTGSGKTIIISALMESILFGTDKFEDQPNAIFLWLSDSPALNEQSKQKIETKADRIRYGACITIEDDSFDQEMLDDGCIYFLNIQKISKSGNLTTHGDNRQYTIWETIENTTKNKSDRFYFIIDEAHRGMQRQDAGVATSIMQRFIKGSPAHGLSPVPLIIGMSATSERFNTLVEGTTSGINKVIVKASEVRLSGLLKDRIIIKYPDNPDMHNDMSVLQAATDEWIKKSEHWYMYNYEQHTQNVYPILLIQVQAGTGQQISDTNLDDVISKIEERCAKKFKEGEIVHTFGSYGTIEANGLAIHHVEPEDINDNRHIRIVLFKENLTTGWDCPRAETMMSFKKADDATYIAQLLGRMVRTPLGNSVTVDDYLNDVRLFLPFFNRETVADVVKEYQNSEGEELPSNIESESLEESVYITWTSRPRHRKIEQTPGQLSIIDYLQPTSNTDSKLEDEVKNAPVAGGEIAVNKLHDEILSGFDPKSLIENKKDGETKRPITETSYVLQQPVNISAPRINVDYTYEQLKLSFDIDREGVTKFINQQALISYVVRSQKIYGYLKSLLDLSSLLTITKVYPSATEIVKSDVADMIHAYVDALKEEKLYDVKALDVLKFKLQVDVFDVFGNTIKGYSKTDTFFTSDSDLDRQLRAAEMKLGGGGFCQAYGNKYLDNTNPNSFKIDCILYAASENCLAELNKYAESKFNEFNDSYRRKFAVMDSDQYLSQYKSIIRNSDKVTKGFFRIPENIQVKENVDGKLYYNHLFVNDDTSAARIKLNNWEEAVIQEESERDDFVCWLRNPSGSWGLCIPYEMNNEIKGAYPDFIIIRKDMEGAYIIDILEPHMPSLADNLGKAKGFAKYAEQEMHIGRFELIRLEKDITGKERPKRLDMCKGSVRQKIKKIINTDELDHIFDEEGFFK